MHYKNFILSVMSTMGTWWAAYSPLIEGFPKWFASLAGAFAAFYFAKKTHTEYLITKERLRKERGSK